MKIAVLFGSPHKDGNTARLVHGVLQGIPGAQATSLFAYDHGVAPCVGCGGCRDTARCVKYRDMDEVVAVLSDAELILIAFPIYFAGLPAPLKAVIDRLQPLYCATYARGIRPEITRRSIILASSGGSVSEGMLGIKTLQYVSNLFGAKLLGIITAQNTDGPDAEKQLQNAVNDALGLINA